jgi:hypothetical protein
MELKRIVVQLWNGTDEYEDFVDADLRPSIRQVEVHSAESAGEGVIRIPKRFHLSKEPVGAKGLSIKDRWVSPESARP